MILLLLSLTVTESSLADQVKYIPLGTPMELSVDGVSEVVRCYRLDEFKILLGVDFSLQEVKSRLRIYEDIDLKYEEIISEKDEIIQVLKKEKEIYRDRSERMEANWHSAEELAISVSEGPFWPYIAAGVGAVIGVVGTTLYVQEMLRK